MSNIDMYGTSFNNPPLYWLVLDIVNSLFTDNIYLQIDALRQKKNGEQSRSPLSFFTATVGINITCFNDFTAFGHCDVWKRKAGVEPIKQIKNRRLWQAVDELRSGKYVEVEKVRAHSGVRGNEIADSLAVDATRSDIDSCNSAACRHNPTCRYCRLFAFL